MPDSIPDHTGEVPLDAEAVIASSRQATCTALHLRLVAVINEFGPRHHFTSYELEGVLAEVRNTFLLQRMNAGVARKLSTQRENEERGSAN